MNRIDALTGSRFFAALIVVMYHLGGKDIPAVRPLVNLAPYMISFFFVLSGFVLTLAHHRPGTPFDFKHFWVARISRIFPIYLFSLFLVCVHLTDTLGKIKTGDYLSAVFLLQAWIPENALIFNFPLWALTPELLFYLIFPFVSLLVARQPVRRLIWASLGIWAITQLTRYTLAVGGFDVHPNFISYFPLLHMDSFLLGVVGGLWFHSENRLETINPTTNFFILLGSLAIVVVQATIKIVPHVGTMNGMFSPFFAVFILTLAMDRTWVSRVLSHKWLVALGGASYALYVFHVPVYWLYSDVFRALGLFLPLEIQFVLYLPVLILLSVLVFRHIELPVQNWLRADTRRLFLVVMDLTILSFAIWQSYIIRVGSSLILYQPSMRFATRIGVPILFALLIPFGWYLPSQPAHKVKQAMSLIVPLLSGFLILGAIMFFALQLDWIPTYPRSFTAIGFLFAVGLLPFSRLLYRMVAKDI